MRPIVVSFCALALLLAASPAWAQSAAEPLDLDPEGAVTRFAGRIPFAVDDDPDRARPGYDDSDWPTITVPALWHTQGFDRSERSGWYRLHLRLPESPTTRLGVILPPVVMTYELFLNGRRIDHSGMRDGRAGAAWREGRRVVPLDRWLLREGDNVLAIRTRSVQGLGGIGGGFLFGRMERLERRAQLRSLFVGGLFFVFAVGAAFMMVVWLANRRDRQTLLLAVSMGAVALAMLASNEHWYLLFESTEWKIRMRHASRLGLHGVGVLFCARVIGTHFQRPANTLAIAASVAALVSLVGSFRLANELAGLSWMLTTVCLLYVLDLARGLPLQSTLVRSGLRATLVGALFALGLEVVTRQWELPGPGAFELAFLPVTVALSTAVAAGSGVAHLRAARIVRASRDGLVLLRGDGVVELSNPALQGLLGRSARELIREGLSPSFSDESWGRLQATMRRLLEAGEAGTPELVELEVLRAGGALQVELLGAALDTDRLLLAVRDVTRRQALEREVARAQRLDSLGMLAGGIAHDFNNLLAGILASASDLSSQGPEEHSARVTSIEEAARRGGALTQRLLQFAQGRLESPLGVDLGETIPNLVQMLGRTLGKRVQWSVDLEADLPLVALSESELEQVLVNLCVNARDAMSSGAGQIAVSARRRDEPEGERVVLLVEDSGRGMPRDLLERVFEPFVTTKGSGAGTGLGLAVVYGIVTRRGGLISIRSQVGEGTEVRVSLPTQREAGTTSLPQEGAVDAAAAEAAYDPEGSSVLLVDDEPALRNFLGKALERRGLEVLTLGDGEAALQWMADVEGECPIDAVIMDMQMPVVDGMEATTALRERWPGLPVVISSGYTGRDSIASLEETGPTMVLEKPYRVEDLIKALGRVTRPS